MKTNKNIDTYFDKTKTMNKKTQSLNRFKDKSQIIMDQYATPQVPNDKLYMIDKVVRLRAQEGRFGVDHSEILNYEFEMANKDRTNHLDMLVNQRTTTLHTPTKNNKENFAASMASNMLMDRLTVRDSETKYPSTQGGMSYQEWVRRKDA